MHEFDDVELSALLDGELTADAEARLRVRIAGESALAERLAELAALGSQLRELGATESAPARLAAIRAGLERRIASETRSQAPARPVASRGDARSRTGDGRTTRERRVWPWAASAAALAAALLLYLLAGPSTESAPGGERRSAPSIVQQDPASEPGPRDGLAEELGEEVSDGLSDEELAIALELETLANYEVIEQLEVLELLALLERAEPI